MNMKFIQVTYLNGYHTNVDYFVFSLKTSDEAIDFYCYLRSMEYIEELEYFVENERKWSDNETQQHYYNNASYTWKRIEPTGKEDFEVIAL